MLTNQWYESMVEDCQTILIECGYRYRMELIEMKHAIGERICNDPYFKKIQGQKAQKSIIQKLAQDIGISKTDAYYCVQFFEKYPNLSGLTEKSKEQKKLSWNTIVRKYLPTKKEEKEVDCEHEVIIKICQDCKIRIK